jgi:hypothetical protein
MTRRVLIRLRWWRCRLRRGAKGLFYASPRPKPERLTEEELQRLARLRARLSDPRFRDLLWAEFDAWQASRDAAAWAPLFSASGAHSVKGKDSTIVGAVPITNIEA